MPERRKFYQMDRGKAADINDKSLSVLAQKQAKLLGAVDNSTILEKKL